PRRSRAGFLDPYDQRDAAPPSRSSDTYGVGATLTAGSIESCNGTLPMRRLTLIKHARPQVDPHTSSDQWTLADEGRAAAAALAHLLPGQAFARIVSSEDPKARATAAIIGTKPAN